MLRRLYIRNYALIEHLELELEQGFTVFTGETGAGKSILVGALGLLLGARAGRTGNTPGSAEGNTEVSAEFDALSEDGALHRLLDAQDFQPGAGGLLLRRVLEPGGRGRAYLNAAPAPLQVLRAAGQQLAELQGQHAQHALRRPEARLALLDAGGGYEQALHRVRAAHSAWEQARRAWQDTGPAEADGAADLETLRGQLEELAALAARPKELEQLFERQSMLAEADRILETCAVALAELEAEDALPERLHRLREALRELPVGEALEQPLGLLEEARIRIDEAASDLRRFTDRLERDPGQLAEIEQRLEELHRVARRQGVRPEDLPVRRAELERRLQRSEQNTARRAELERQLQQLHSAYSKAAGLLGRRRKECAARLAREVTKRVAALGMPHARFTMELRERDPDKPHREGLQRVNFLFSAHPEHPPAPLQDVASGGELSRLCLALLATCGGHRRDLPLLIFDEVDAGVGGATGELIGRLLAGLSGNRQVLCVTHLPQLAACARHHYRVWKERGEDGRTHIHAAPLDGAQRVEETARMLGGQLITPRTRAHAEELLGTLGTSGKTYGNPAATEAPNKARGKKTSKKA